MRKIIALALVGFGLVLGAACAKSAIPDDDAGTDGGMTDPSCPQYDLSNDAKHCGSCTKACSAGQICSQALCKAECDAPMIKCGGDAGGCVDLQADLKNCGACGKACTPADAGGMMPGNGNPDPMIDGGVDGGIGWTVGLPSCSKGMCGVGCSNGLTACGGICYDTQNHHENCGSCGGACQQTEWCNSGHCCDAGKLYCNNACIDVSNDDANCGACGKACGNGLHCSNGTCQSCGGYASINSCWYVSALGASCNTTCQNHGGLDTVNGKHSGNPICTHFFPAKANGSDWMTVECCSTDNNTNWGANNSAVDGTFTFAACYLACPCKT